MISPDPDREDSDWIAVRYVLGELSAADAKEFERRLADDQTLRESVVRASRLVTTLADLPQSAARRTSVRQRGSRHRPFVVAASIAAVLAASVGIWRTLDDKATPEVGKDLDPARLVVLWSDASDPVTENMEIEFAAETIDATLAPPDWLLAAVEQEVKSIESVPSLDPGSNEIETN